MKRSTKGFTLVEMLIVIIAVGIIGSITTRLLYQGSNIFIRETNRQGFVNEVRSTFWRVIRETHGQVSKEQFTFSGSDNLYIKHANNITKQIETSGQFVTLKIGNNNSNELSDTFSSTSSTGLTYYDNNYNIISISQNALSDVQAKTIHLVKIDFVFKSEEDSLNLSSYIFPQNFKYGEKMEYHD